MKGKIIVIGMPEEDKPRFRELATSLKKEMKLEYYDHADQIPLETKNPVIYCYQKSNALALTNDLKLIRKRCSYSQVNVILMTKDYDSLMVSYSRGICHILERPLTLKSLKRSFIKARLMQDMGKNMDEVLPYTKLLSLFSTPTKIHYNSELITYIGEYCSHFSGVKNFIAIEMKQLVTQIFPMKKIGRPQEAKVLDFIEQHKGSLNEIGKSVSEKIDQDLTITLFPMILDEERIFGCIITKKIKTSRILNAYFTKFLKNVSLYRSTRKEAVNLKQLALTDEVTGLYNQRKLAEDLKNQIIWHAKNNKKFCVMFIDVDHFKVVNDKWGHVVGSNMLIQIGSLLRKTLRQTDYIYRYGGDEFVVIMPDAEIKNVLRVAMRIGELVKLESFIVDNEKHHNLSLSIGLSEYPTDAQTASEIINFADVMMYKSKRTGRGKVFHVNEVEAC